MKRFLLVLFVLILAGSGGAYWWLTRESSLRVAESALQSLIGLKTVGAARIDFATTNPRTNATTGFTFVGQLNLADATLPEALGSLRLGAKTTTDLDQTVDLIVTKEQVIIRPRTGKPQADVLAKMFARDPSGQSFFAADRTIFTNVSGLRVPSATGRNSAVRQAMASLVPALILTGELELGLDGAGRKIASTSFRVDRRLARPFLISLVSAWTGKEPTIDQYSAIDRAVEGLARGSFRVTVDRSSRELVSLTGSWPRVDDEGNELSRLGIDLGFAGHNTEVTIGIPEGALDVTSELGGNRPVPSLPSSIIRPGAATNTSPAVIPKFDPSQIDLFQQYSEELNRKKNLY
jgi:hypothetical protein